MTLQYEFRDAGFYLCIFTEQRISILEARGAWGPLSLPQLNLPFCIPVSASSKLHQLAVDMQTPCLNKITPTRLKFKSRWMILRDLSLSLAQCSNSALPVFAGLNPNAAFGSGFSVSPRSKFTEMFFPGFIPMLVVLAIVQWSLTTLDLHFAKWFFSLQLYELVCGPCWLQSKPGLASALIASGYYDGTCTFLLSQISL